MIGAESYFLKAIEADPKNARNLGNYAVFLATQRGDDAGADSYHLKAIENAPQDSAILSNYGQFSRGAWDGWQTDFERFPPHLNILIGAT